MTHFNRDALPPGISFADGELPRKRRPSPAGLAVAVGVASALAATVVLTSVVMAIVIVIKPTPTWPAVPAIAFFWAVLAATAAIASFGLQKVLWPVNAKDGRAEDLEAHWAQAPFDQLAELESLASLLTGPPGQYGIGKQVQRCRTIAALFLSTNAEGELALSRQQVSDLFYKLAAMDDYLSDVLEHPALWRHPRDHASRDQLRMATAHHGRDLYDRIMEKNGFRTPFSATRMPFALRGEPADDATRSLAAAKQETTR